MENLASIPQARGNTQRLVETALMLAIGTALSLFQPFQLPFGGGITIVSMLPMILLAYRYGVKWGFLSSFVFSVLQMLCGFHTVSAFFLPGDDQQLWWKAILICLLDYVLAYTVLGLGGIFRNRMKNPSMALCLGSVAAILARYVMHFLSGSIFFGSYAEWFFTQDSIASFGQQVLGNMSGPGLAMFYSLCYNGSYLIPEMILTAIVGFIIGKVPYLTRKF